MAGPLTEQLTAVHTDTGRRVYRDEHEKWRQQHYVIHDVFVCFFFRYCPPTHHVTTLYTMPGGRIIENMARNVIMPID